MGVPVPSRSPAMGAHVALDELVIGGFHAVRGSISPEEVERIDAEAGEAITHFGDAGWLDDPASYHRAPGPPLTPTFGRRRVGRTSFETLRFDSEWAPHPGEPGSHRWDGYERNRRVRVLLRRHRGGPRPWVVCVHGAEMGGRPLIDTRILRVEHLHRKLGLNVAIPVLPMHGPRRPDVEGAAGFPGLDLVDDVHGLAQAAWDVRRLIAWIRTQDPVGVGITGFSLGGYVAALVAGLEQPLDAVVAGCPAVDLPSLFRRGATSAMRHDGRFESLMAKGEELLPVVSPLSFAPATPADRCFIYAGLVDRLAHPVEQAAELARHWGDPHVLWFAGGHVSCAFNGEVSAFVDDALRTNL
ncbi:MAG: alpha/beta hydrolase family protein [Acidimicrobiales bacterium]